MKKVKGGITRPKGFFAGAAHAGIKFKKKDLCLIYSQVPAYGAGVFTSNRIKAAPLIVSKKHLRNGKAQAIVANSGNANCLTGKAGLNDAESIAKGIAKALSIKKSNILVASTGVIGRKLPISRITSAIDKLISSLGSANSTETATAIMTTDTVPKEIAVSFKIGSKEVNIGAVAKGAGMIHPNMATMLAFITTDAAITLSALNKALKESVNTTFNSITVDGDMSTNDCVFILANGLAGNKTIAASGKGYELFRKALTAACQAMSEKIVRDAEGATKFVEIKVTAAKNEQDAKKAAFAIATSPLVKTAAYGEDPNWGRIAAAVGRSGADVHPSKLDIYLGRSKVLSNGMPANVSKALLREIFKKRDIGIKVVLNNGSGEATVYTSDLTKEYVNINAHYTS
jgi:glutamate N-acetyltransferase/amino-acid N-acetyltransferase